MDEIEAAQYRIEDSDDDEQFSMEETLAQLDKTEAEFRIKNKSKPNTPIGRDDGKEQQKTPRNIKASQFKSPEIPPPSKMIQNFFAKNTNETQEKRSRPSLLDCLEDDYRKSPAKMKCNAKTPTPTKISMPVDLNERLASPALVKTTVQSPIPIENETQEEQLGHENAASSSTKDVEMATRIETPTTAEDNSTANDQADCESANTSNSEANKSKKAVTPKQQKAHNTTPKSMQKQRAFMDNYFTRLPPKSDPKPISRNIFNSEQDEVTAMEVDVPISSEELESEINNETDQLKALHVASDQVIVDIEDSPVIT